MLFTETQQFRQPWLWSVLLVVLIAVLGGTFFTFRQQAPFTWSKVSLGVATLLVLAVIAGIYFAKLSTVVKPDGLYIRFFPFHLSAVRIAAEELKTVEAVEYDPLLDYGGWGIRQSTAGKAYSVGGNRAVKLTFVLPERKPLLVGSNHAEELAAAIERAASR